MSEPSANPFPFTAAILETLGGHPFGLLIPAPCNGDLADGHPQNLRYISSNERNESVSTCPVDFQLFPHMHPGNAKMWGLLEIDADNAFPFTEGTKARCKMSAINLG